MVLQLGVILLLDIHSVFTETNIVVSGEVYVRLSHLILLRIRNQWYSNSLYSE
jgi:hypothetical protein